MNRKKAGICLLALSLVCLGACRKQPKYTNDLTAAELAKDAQIALQETEYLEADGNYLSDYVQLPDGMDDYRICFASDGNNLNEFGIWHAESGKTEEMRALLAGYLKSSLEKNRSFYDSYIPQETPKLRDAEVRVYGNYVAYAIMNDTDRQRFFHTLEQDLLIK